MDQSNATKTENTSEASAYKSSAKPQSYRINGKTNPWMKEINWKEFKKELQ